MAGKKKRIIAKQCEKLSASLKLAKIRAAVLAPACSRHGFECRYWRQGVLSQQELASRLGVSRRTIVRIEKQDALSPLWVAALAGIGLLERK